MDTPLRQRAFLEATRSFLSAQTAQDVIETVMRAGQKLTGAAGASFVSFDEWGNALMQLTHGAVPESALTPWPERLNQPAVRQVCRNCKLRHAGAECALLHETLPGSGSYVVCQPVLEDGREMGLVNFFYDQPLPEAARAQLAELAETATAALAAIRRRDREITALRYLQSSSAPHDLPELLTGLVQNLREALDTRSALLWVPDGLRGGLSTPSLLPLPGTDQPSGDVLPELPIIGGIWQTVRASRQTISMQNVSLSEKKVWKNLLAVPLAWRDEEPIGLLLLGSERVLTPTQRQLMLIQNVAGQAALLIQNARLMVQIEYQAVVEERTRLAREIHDGLAQTLAFLKIQSAQMQNYLQQGKMEKLESTLQASHQTLSEAYQDARQAIDNLRSIPESSVQDWIYKIASDFEKNTDAKVDLTALKLDYDFPPTVQAQLVRIVQEALGNVRKHARASKVTISGSIRDNEAILEVRDNGIGFEPELVATVSRYGLLGMRERADLIGAEFQIESKPGNGTTIRLSFPIKIEV